MNKPSPILADTYPGSGFPKEFLWGAATAAYQIEGAAREGGRAPSNWDEFSHRPGKIYRGDTGDIAADHYHRLESDLDLMSELGLRAYRFSVSWSRIMPDDSGKPNPIGMDFYDRLLTGLRSRGITPMVTIVHMELPLWLEERGGWAHRETADRFVEYAQVLHDAFADRIRHWITLNEAVWIAWLGYGNTIMPPGRDQRSLVLPSMHNQLRAHGLAARALRSADAGKRKNEYGIVGSWWPAHAATPDPADERAAEFVNDAMNRITTEPIFNGRYPERLLDWHERAGGRDFIEPGDFAAMQGSSDFFGLNYYAPVYVVNDPNGGTGLAMPPGLGATQRDPEGATRSAMGWVIDADSFYQVLKIVHRDYRIPLYITENGIAVEDYVSPQGTVNDIERIAYLDSHIRALGRAMDEGVDVRGYMTWSLMDNFEWAYGYSKRFGLVHVDYATQRRTPKQGYHWYRGLIAAWQDRNASRAS